MGLTAIESCRGRSRKRAKTPSRRLDRFGHSPFKLKRLSCLGQVTINGRTCEVSRLMERGQHSAFTSLHLPAFLHEQACGGFLRAWSKIKKLSRTALCYRAVAVLECSSARLPAIKQLEATKR